MARCKWCDRRKWWISLDGNDLCGACRKEVIPSIERHNAAINHSRNIVSNAASRSLKIKNCLTVIEHAEKLRVYAVRGIPVGDADPSGLITEYRTIHDRLLIEQHESVRSLAAGCNKAEKALSGFANLLHVRDALDSIEHIRRLLPSIQSPTVIAFINQKGGVGKTTSTINLGAGLAKHNKRVLLIDFDPQANLTDGLGIDETSLTANIFDVLKGKISTQEAIVSLNDRLAVIPSDVTLSRAEKELAREQSNIFLLKRAVDTIHGYDFVLIDCPPSLGILSLNALTASNFMIVPVQPEYYSMKGLRKVMDALEFVQRKINPGIRIMGVVGTRYDPRKKLHSEVIDTLRSGLSNGAFINIVRENIAVAEAASFGKSIFDYNPGSPGAEDYLQLTLEVLNIVEHDVLEQPSHNLHALPQP